MASFIHNIFRRGSERARESVGAAQQQFEAFMQEAMNAHPQQAPTHRGPPPASARAIRQLPTIQVTPEDLVDPSNRECCICLEENHLHDHVVRLPCAHIFHTSCVRDWLSRCCTCPVCRYELETDDPNYERTRKERMRHRKPRYARYELERMSIRELRGVCTRVRLSTTHIVDKSDLIQQLVECNRLDIIAAPEPVEYPLSLLSAMKISELKSCMSDAGVFFDPQDVVEKQDMISIFVNSGRLVLIAEEEEKEDVEMNEEEGDQREMMQEAELNASEHSQDSSSHRKRKHQPVVTTVDSDDEGESQYVEHDASARHGALSSFIEPVDEADLPPNNVSEGSGLDAGAGHCEDDSEQGPMADDVESDQSAPQEQQSSSETDRIEEAQAGVRSIRVEAVEDSVMPESEQNANDEPRGLEDDDTTEMDDIPWVAGRHADASASSLHSTTSVDDGHSTSASVSIHSTRFRERNIAELRALARELQVDISDCLERSDIIARLVNSAGVDDDATESNHASQASQRHYRPRPSHFERWSVSELRALANEVNVDLSDCADRDDMVQKICDAAERRPHMADYLGALAPLARLTVSQLRAVAREWQVNVWDCLEKDEIIHRLVSASAGAS